MEDLNQLFESFLNIRVDDYNKDTDVFELDASPEEVLNLLVNLANNFGLILSDFCGDFPITFNYLVRCINETRNCN